jgi:hypothetical protein
MIETTRIGSSTKAVNTRAKPGGILAKGDFRLTAGAFDFKVGWFE